MHAVALAARGHIEVATGDLDAARDRLRTRPCGSPLATRDRPVIARVLGLAAAIALAGGDAGRAGELLGTAEVLRGMPDEADVDLRRVREAARAALGDRGFALAFGRGAARPREEVLAALAAEVSSAAGRPAAPAERTPPPIAAAQASAPRAGAATSPPTSRPRTASTSRVAGLTSTQACIQPGMVATGTKALLAKVSGNTTTNPSI